MLETLLTGGGFCVHATDLASRVPHGDWVVVGGVSSGARWVDPAELVHVVVDVRSSCKQAWKKPQNKTKTVISITFWM